MREFLRAIYVYLYPIFFLYGKKDKVVFLNNKYKHPKNRRAAKDTEGYVCQVKYHSYLGWTYNIDCGSGFVMVKSKDVKRLSRGWIHDLKLRFTSLESAAKAEKEAAKKGESDQWEIIQD